MIRNSNLTASQNFSVKQLQSIWKAKKKELGLSQERVAKLCKRKTYL